MKLNVQVCLACVVACSMSPQAFASMISVNDVFNDWTHGASPVDHGTTGAWFVSGTTIQGSSNHRGSLVSDFSASGNSTFKVDTRARDNDTFGLMWGVQDLANHYRFSWAQNYGETGVGTPTQVGFDGPYDGFKIIKEVAGTSSLLFSSNTEYVQGHNYTLSVTGTNTGFDVLVQNITTAATVFNVSIADTSFTSGGVGIHEMYQGSSNVWSNFDFTAGDNSNAVPEPTSIAMWGLVGGLGLVIARRRKRMMVA